MAPQRIAGAEPSYPALEALSARQGEVILEILVRADGSVMEAQVRSVTGSQAFVASAREAVLGWRFEPAQRKGKPVDCLCVQRLVFKLEGHR